MPRVLTVTTLDQKRGKIKLRECISWKERHPKKTYTVYLHRTPNGQWFIEHRYLRAKLRSFSREYRLEWAIHWLVEEEHEVPKDCEVFDHRIDIARERPSRRRNGVINYCLNCIRQSRTTFGRLPSVYEELILSVVDETPRVGREIARAAGLPFSSHFRTTLATLVKTHALENVGKHRGYRRAKDLT
jgi:hypothetical protein